MLGSQAVGLITVLAISGSVILLSLGKQKLLLLRNYVSESAREESSSDSGLSAFFEAKSSEDGVLCASDLPKEGKASRIRMESCSHRLSMERELVNESKDCNSWISISEDGVCCSPRISSMVVSSLRTSSAVACSPTFASAASEIMKSLWMPANSVQDVSNATADHARSDSGSSKVAKKKKKKVRFSADVVEPAGNNEEYRRQMNSRKTTDARGANSSCKSSSNDKICGVHKAAASNDDSSRSFLPGSHARPGQASSSSSSSFRNQDRKVLKSVAQPNMPANRLALYKGIYQYRSQCRAIY